MTRPTDDSNQTDLVAGYILDDLSPEEVAYLNQALAESPTLYEEIELFGEAFSLLPYDLPIVEPSARLKDRIISAASQSIAGTSPESSRSKVVPLASPRHRSWKRWIPAISTSIAAVAVMAFGLNQVQLIRQSQQTVALQQQLEATNTELNRLKSELQSNQRAIALLSQPNTQMYSLVSSPTISPSSQEIRSIGFGQLPIPQPLQCTADSFAKMTVVQRSGSLPMQSVLRILRSCSLH
jgi:hypothetical protein